MLTILYLQLPPGVLTTNSSSIFLPISSEPTGDSFEILFSKVSASADPTIVYVTSSSNSKS